MLPILDRKWNTIHIYGQVRPMVDLVDRIQSRALKLIGDDRVASSITSLGHHRNVSCVVLFYKYYFGKCSSGFSAPGIREEY